MRFSELIWTIDQLADEEIDEVVDWQMTESPAAKVEGTGLTGLWGRLSGGQRPRMPNQNGGPNRGGNGQLSATARPVLPPTDDPIDDDLSITVRPWMAESSPPRLPATRLEVPMETTHDLVIPRSMMLNMMNPLQDGSRWTLPTYHRITVSARTWRDEPLGVINVRMSWSINGAVAETQTFRLNYEMLADIRYSIDVMRQPLIEGRILVLALSEGRLRLFMEYP